MDMTEKARRVGRGIFAMCARDGEPLALAYGACEEMFETYGVEKPDDLLAFLTKGEKRDADLGIGPPIWPPIPVWGCELRL